MVHAEPFQVDVVYSAAAGHSELVSLLLAGGSSVADAITASGFLQRYELPAEQLLFGIWGKVRVASTLLRPRDRVEIYRPLQVDPKEARRQRYRKDRPARLRKAAPTESSS